MEADQAERALSRIEAALARIEAVAARGSTGDSALAERHARLREEVALALRQMDTLIASGGDAR